MQGKKQQHWRYDHRALRAFTTSWFSLSADALAVLTLKGIRVFVVQIALVVLRATIVQSAYLDAFRGLVDETVAREALARFVDAHGAIEGLLALVPPLTTIADRRRSAYAI